MMSRGEMTTGEDTHGCDYFTSLFLLPQLCNSTSTAADELMENPLVVKAWTQTESRRDVVTEKKAPKNLYTVGQALNRPSPQEDADV